MNKIKTSSNHSGFNHWILQKITAIALIPLVVWLVMSLLQIAQNPIIYLPIFFSYWFNATMSILLIVTSLYHGTLGMQVVFEDYISSKSQRIFYINLIRFLSIFVGFAVSTTILKLYIVGSLIN